MLPKLCSKPLHFLTAPIRSRDHVWNFFSASDRKHWIDLFCVLTCPNYWQENVKDGIVMWFWADKQTESINSTMLACSSFLSCPYQGCAGTLQVSCPVSGVCRYPASILSSVRGMQVPCRYPVQCQGYATKGLLSSDSVFPRQLGDFLLAPAGPIEKVTQWEGLLY